MEPLGPAVFAMDANFLEEFIPDTDGKTQDEIDNMPPYIRSFRCGKRIESGEPTCDDSKYTNLPGVPDEDPCSNFGHASWHPGWYVWHWLR